jgi:hypothetical protein
MSAQNAPGTVDATRFNKMMGNYQKALAMLAPEQRETLKGSAQGADFDSLAQTPEGGSRPTAETAQPETYQDGESYTFVDGKFVPFEPPTPGQHGESSGRFAPAREPSLRDMVPDPHAWPDIAAR